MPSVAKAVRNLTAKSLCDRETHIQLLPLHCSLPVVHGAATALPRMGKGSITGRGRDTYHVENYITLKILSNFNHVCSPLPKVREIIEDFLQKTQFT